MGELRGDVKAGSGFDILSKKHGSNTGRVAVARAMLKTIYVMVKNHQAFHPIVKGTTGQRPGVMTG